MNDFSVHSTQTTDTSGVTSDSVTSDAARKTFDQTDLSSRYELLEEVGRGGMGIVFRGRHRLLGQTVAIKLHTVPEGVQRFHREAQVLASIHSPHVVSVHDFEILPSGLAMFVMPWIAGNDLGRLLSQSVDCFPESRVLKWMLQVCDGMQTAASQGIVHRDLKPSNILIDEKDTAYVLDFGLARSGSVTPLTQSGGLMGTPYYMSPEQAEDPRAVDTRADIYSYGALFYHVVTRQAPFTGDSWFSILLKHKTEPLISPKSHIPEISERLSDCLERCLAKSPRDRFQTFSDISNHFNSHSADAHAWNSPADAAIARILDRYRSRISSATHPIDTTGLTVYTSALSEVDGELH
jgi:serine/threonine protein kinase